MVNPQRSRMMLKHAVDVAIGIRAAAAVAAALREQILTFHVKDPGKQTDHEQKAHSAHEHGELVSRAPRLPVDSGRSTETVYDRKMSAAGHRGGVNLLWCHHRGWMYGGEICQIRGCE